MILFTADWHIKLGQKNVPKEWQTNRFRMLFKKVLLDATNADCIIIGGDVFDRMPSIEELSLFLEFVSMSTILDKKIYLFCLNIRTRYFKRRFMLLIKNYFGIV